MNLDKFEQGEDIFRSVTLYIGNVVADTADFDTIEVDVFHKHSLIKIGEYSVAGGTVDTPAPTTDGVITFIVSRTETDDAQTGIYQYEIITTETDADYEAGSRTRKYKGDCFILVDSNE